MTNYFNFFWLNLRRPCNIIYMATSKYRKISKYLYQRGNYFYVLLYKHSKTQSIRLPTRELEVAIALGGEVIGKHVAAKAEKEKKDFEAFKKEHGIK